MKALFINPGGIGDQILLLPAVRLLKEAFPQSEIDIILEPRSETIGEITNYFRKIKTFDFKDKNPNIFHLRELIRKQRYKYIISSGSSYKANFICSLGDADIKIGFYKGLFSKLFLTDPVKLNLNQYTANMLAELVMPILPEAKHKIETTSLIPEIKLNMQLIDWVKEVLKPRIKERYFAKKILIHPGTSKLSIKKNILKGWSAKNWATLIEKLLENKNNTVILLGGKDDIETVNEIHNKLSFFARPDNYIDFSSMEMSLSRLAALISTSDLLVCVDSAPMHLAVGLGKKLVAFFGPTDPKKLLPYDPRFIPVHVTNLECRPCLFTVRTESCSTPVCLDVTPGMMLTAINKQLNLTKV